MLNLEEIAIIFIVTVVVVSTENECVKTKFIVSKCYSGSKEKYQWLIEIPQSENSCNGKSVPDPRAVSCDFACPKGQTFNKFALGCRNCSVGSYSLGGGYQYTFSEATDLSVTAPELSLKSTSKVDMYHDVCKKKQAWQVKGGVLQGDVIPNCDIHLSLAFKLERAGSISIEYNLATSYVFGYITSRCDFNVKNNNNIDDDDDDDLRRRNMIFLKPTGYGVWMTKKFEIDEAGEYALSLFTFNLNTFHFPFSIRSIVIEGNSFLQDCIPCPPGTFSATIGAGQCMECPVNTHAPDEGSSQCKPCDEKTEYADEGSSKCLARPPCELKHYQKVFVGCDKSNMSSASYEPIQPKICINGIELPPPVQVPCGSCNPGMYKTKDNEPCQFCPPKTYSDGTRTACLPCANDLSLLPGLYYKIWNELPKYLTRNYLSFDETNYVNKLLDSQSWVPSVEFISSQSLPETLSVLSLTIDKGFRSTDIVKVTKEYGTLYFKFSMQCQSSCTLFLVYEDIFNDRDDDWEVIQKWNVKQQTNHENRTAYTYPIQYPNEIKFSWLFTSDDPDQGVDEVRIYEIRVTNTETGGSDRCVSCLTTNNQETECKSCTPGHILASGTCTRCPPSTIATRVRLTDPVATVCKPCPNNTVSDDGTTCYVPCRQAFQGNTEYDLSAISTLDFHGSKLFTQKGSGYFHVFNASICGKTTVTCAKTPTSTDSKRSKNQLAINSKLCRMGSVPDKDSNVTSVAFIDDFGEQLLNVSLLTSKSFPALRSDYNLSDIILVYQANISSSQSSCSEHITYLSLRCDHTIDEGQPNSSSTYQLQTPNDCATGTCDGCTFHFLLRTPLACPTCDENDNGFRTFIGPCKFGKQEVRKIPYPYCSHQLNEKVEVHRCSIFSIEIQIIIGLFIIIAGVLVLVVIFCWRKNRKLEYRYMQLVENNNPDDDAPVDNVCAQISDEEDSGEEVQFQSQSRAKKIMNAVRKVIRKNPTNRQFEQINGDSFLLTTSSTHDA